MLANAISLIGKQNFTGNVTWKEKNYPTKQTKELKGTKLDSLCESDKLVVEAVRDGRFPRRQKSQRQFAQEGYPEESDICARLCPIRTQLHGLRQKEKVIQGQQCRVRKAREPDVWVLQKAVPKSLI